LFFFCDPLDAGASTMSLLWVVLKVETPQIFFHFLAKQFFPLPSGLLKVPILVALFCWALLYFTAFVLWPQMTEEFQARKLSICVHSMPLVLYLLT
jgi:hypothetical protein